MRKTICTLLLTLPLLGCRREPVTYDEQLAFLKTDMMLSQRIIIPNTPQLPLYERQEADRNIDSTDLLGDEKYNVLHDFIVQANPGMQRLKYIVVPDLDNDYKFGTLSVTEMPQNGKWPFNLANPSLTDPHNMNNPLNVNYQKRR